MRAGTGSCCLYILVSGIWYTPEECLMKEREEKEERGRGGKKEGRRKEEGKEGGVEGGRKGWMDSEDRSKIVSDT